MLSQHLLDRLTLNHIVSYGSPFYHLY
uniref:Uncharacterized protein n=1 Tax=Rhizophora mucronata TaxID=61149 RepID=A0A2P2PQG4_RHIMU